MRVDCDYSTGVLKFHAVVVFGSSIGATYRGLS